MNARWAARWRRRARLDRAVGSLGTACTAVAVLAVYLLVLTRGHWTPWAGR